MVSTVINRRQTSFSRASDRICLSNVSTEFAPQQDVQAAIAKAPPHRADLAQTDPYGHGHTGYCNPEVDKLIDQQSAEADPAKRKQLMWQIERRLAEDGARPIIFYPRGETCTQPYVTGLVTMVNSIYNGYRIEDVWLDK